MQPGGEAVADIGHVHLKVSDLERAVGFYRDLVGMTLRNTHQGAAFLAFGDYHHHLGLNTWRSRGGGPPAPETTGLYHFAVRYANRRDLAAALNAFSTVASTSIRHRIAPGQPTPSICAIRIRTGSS